MSNGTASLRRKIGSAGDLQSVVRMMKVVAAANIGQYERSVRALEDYYRTVELGLSVCFRDDVPATSGGENHEAGPPEVVVFGSDQGLVGRFNDVVADFAVETLATLRGTPRVWAVGERVRARLLDAGLQPVGLYAVPDSINGIAALVGQILVQGETSRSGKPVRELHLFYNRPASGAAYAPITQRLLPLDDVWRQQQAAMAWPTKTLPEVLDPGAETLRALIREYLFVSLFRVCAESLASENASRLAAMQRADTNIDDLLTDLNGTFHRLRQSGIDEELFDVISGFEALSKGRTPRAPGQGV